MRSQVARRDDKEKVMSGSIEHLEEAPICTPALQINENAAGGFSPPPPLLQPIRLFGILN
jgi:hypothetical protein